MFEFRDNVVESMLAIYDRTKASFEEDVAIVKKWAQSQPHFPEIMDDNRIRNFLLLNKCSIEKTKEKIDNYYTMRTLIPEFYRDVDEPEILKSREIAYWLILPKMTEDLCRIHILKLRKVDLIDQVEPISYWSRAVQLAEIRLKEDHAFIDIIVIDLQGFNWGFLAKITPTVAKKLFTIIEKVFSNRLKAIHIVNTIPSLAQVLAIVKAIMKPKLFERIHTHKKSEILQNIFSIEILPKDFGGEEKSLEELHELQNKKLNEYTDWLHTLNRMKVDENLRPEKLENDELLGFHGNFKKVDVD